MENKRKELVKAVIDKLETSEVKYLLKSIVNEYPAISEQLHGLFLEMSLIKRQRKNGK